MSTAGTLEPVERQPAVERRPARKLAFGVEPSHRSHRLRLARYKALAEVVADVAKRHRKDEPVRLLDVGVGSGRSMRFIEAEAPLDRFQFVGIDLSSQRLHSVYRPERWQLFQADVQQQIPFETGRFDVVLCEQILEHLETPERVVAEIARVLKPGGTLVLGVPTFPWGVSHLRRLLVHVARRWFGFRSSHVQTYHTSAVRKLISADDRFAVRECYGVRILSGGVLSKLEDCEWWYRFNRWLGRIVPFACTEVQVVAERTGV